MKLVLAIILLSLHFQTLAFKFSPMSQTLLADKEKNSVFYIENDSNQSIAIQVSLAKRVMDENGVEAQPEEKDNLSVYPDQLIIPAGEKRTIKVGWLRKDALKSEEAYRIIAEQLPIDLDKAKQKSTNIKVLLRYVAAFYVSPSSADSNVQLTEIKNVGENIVFKLKNSGNKHQVLTKLSLTYKDGSKNIELNANDLKGMAGENILANSERVFKLPKKDLLKNIKDNQKMVINFEKE